MIPITLLDQFHRKGRGKVFQFYITDLELQEVLDELNDSKFGPFYLITCYFDKEYNYKYDKFKLSDFVKARKQGHYIFFLGNLNLTPELDVPFEKC